MEIALKGIFGALVALGMHFAANSKYPYMAGLIPSIPIFAILGHAIFANSGRSGDLQGAAHFGLVTIGPFILYLVVVWWLSTRTNMWVALILAAAAWSVTTLMVFAAWNQGSESVASQLNNGFAGIVIACTMVGSLLPGTIYLVKYGLSLTKPVYAGLARYRWRPRFGDKSIVGAVAIAIGTTYLLATHVECQTHSARLPGEERVCGILQSALSLEPGDAATQGIQQSIFARYVTLAKNADSAGDADLAKIYSGRARDVLFGSWIDDSKRKPKFC